MKLSQLIAIVMGNICRKKTVWVGGLDSKCICDEFPIFYSLEGVHWDNQQQKYMKNYQIALYYNCLKIIKESAASFQPSQ